MAAGVGAGAGVAYMMGGDETVIFHTIANMIGSISGLICDGGKKVVHLRWLFLQVGRSSRHY